MFRRLLPRATSHLRHNFVQRRNLALEGATLLKLGAVTAGVVVAGVGLYGSSLFGGVDYDAVRKAIVERLDDENWDDGSWGPVFVRLAWHSSGTFCKSNNQGGGSEGATMRFSPECDFGANAGLEHARKYLQPVKDQFPNLSYADLWILAGYVAIEEMGGPRIPFKGGRRDAKSAESCPPDGRLPDADGDAAHVRKIFNRMGFNDQEIVALVGGGHALGRCHTDRSGYKGPWTRAPTTFSNEYFRELLENTWTKKKWNGPEQFEDPTGDLMMLPADMVMRDDPEFRKWCEIYKNDYARFESDFTTAFAKLCENGYGCPMA